MCIMIIAVYNDRHGSKIYVLRCQLCLKADILNTFPTVILLRPCWVNPMKSIKSTHPLKILLINTTTYLGKPT